MSLNGPASYGHEFSAQAYSCDACGMLSIAVLGMDIRFLGIEFEDYLHEVQWQPPCQYVRHHEGVAVNINEAASEAYRCYQFGAYRSAVLMARSVIEAIAKDQGVVEGNLKSKIDAMIERRILQPILGSSAHEIRFFGNEMAHGDFIEPVSEEECDDILTFMEVIIESVYEQPLRLRRVREVRGRRSRRR